MEAKNTINTDKQNYVPLNPSLDLSKNTSTNLTQILKVCILPILRMFLILTFIIITVMIFVSGILLSLLIVYSGMSTIEMIFFGIGGAAVIVCGFLCFFSSICALVDYFKELKNEMDDYNKKIKNYIVTEETDV